MITEIVKCDDCGDNLSINTSSIGRVRIVAYQEGIPRMYNYGQPALTEPNKEVPFHFCSWACLGHWIEERAAAQ